MSRRWLVSCARACTGPTVVRLLTGGLAGIALATVCLQVSAWLGTSLPVSFSVIGAAACGLIFSICRPAGAMERRPWAPLGWSLAFLAWMVATPWLFDAADHWIALPDVMILSAPARINLVLWSLCLVGVGIPTTLIGQFVRVRCHDRSNAAVSGLFLGAALGLVVWCFGAAQIAGPWLCAVMAGGLCVAMSVYRILRPAAVSTDAITSPDISSRQQAAATGGAWSVLLDSLIALSCGGMIAGSTRVLDQLFPGTIYLAAFEAVGVLVGLGLGSFVLSTRWAGAAGIEQRRLAFCVATAVWGIALFVAFPALVQVALWLSAYVSSTALLIWSRGLIAVAGLLPSGFLIAICVGTARDESRTGPRAGARGWLVASVAGYCAGLALTSQDLTTENLLIGCAWWLAMAGMFRFAGRATIPTAWLSRGLYGSAAVVLVAALVWRQQYDVRLSAKLLFNTNVFVGFRMGYGTELLPHLDEGRHIATIQGARGTSTVWRFGGRQLQIRENGMPTGVVSCDPEVFPRHVPEILQTALPLVLHEKPQSLLLLGIGASESLNAALVFPLPEIVCWEGDETRLRVIRELVAQESGADPFEDERVRLTEADPITSLDAEPYKYDVVVSSTDHAALLRAQPLFTESFYRRAARRLEPEGIFCQRLQFIDLGPRPIRSIVRTMQAVFTDVLAIEVAPGEMLLAGTNDPRGLIRPKLLERLEHPHVRGLLGQSGVDWSVLLNVPAYNHEALREFAETGSRGLNRADNDRLAFSLPREVMRWAPKLQEVHQALGANASRMAAWLGPDSDSALLVRRLSEVKGQQDLMANYSDQYWAYRASLRTQITSKPRSKIQQVSASSDKKEMHPEDRRRLRYFSALARAVKTHSAGDIQNLERYQYPYDPLLSYFIHCEAAELYAQSELGESSKELQHRLHAIWFSSPRDASLRNVVAALRLLREHPEAEPDLRRRWDTLNSLLQALQQRWEARAGVKPTDVKAMIQDIDTTVLAAEQTFDVMESLTKEADLPVELWAARKSALDRTLIRPVKSYRSDMLPHLHRKTGKDETEAVEVRPADAAPEAESDSSDDEAS